jgi:SAM-dependent methyltransferase
VLALVGGDVRVAPWIPAPLAAVYVALATAWVGNCDIVYDLGAGDGRVVVIAARDFCARKAVGIEIDPALVEVAKYHVRRERLEDRVSIIEGSFFDVDLSEATVIYIYLYRSVNERLRPKLERELLPGARVVTVDFPIPGWVPVLVRRFEDEGGITRTVHLYVVGLSDTRWTKRSVRPTAEHYPLRILAECSPCELRRRSKLNEKVKENG